MVDTVPSTLKPAEVAVVFVNAAVAKHRDTYVNIFFKAFLAGAMLSFGGLFSEVLADGAAGLNTDNPGIVNILRGFVFPVGLVMIMLQGQELLTSNMMVFSMACLNGAVPWWGLLKNWIIVTFGNLTGSLFIAAIIVKYSGIMSAAPFNAGVQAFAIRKAGDPAWHQIFLRGIGCNWLVCMAFWQAAGARDTISKIVALWIPIWVFVTCSFDHVVANMFYIPLGIMFGANLTTAEYIRKSLIATYCGNIVGALFVALPATWFYLRDHDHQAITRMAAAETGEVNGADNIRETSSTNIVDVKERIN